MTEADKVSELHQEVKNNLLNEDLEKVKNWQKDAYHKQIMGGFKETKEAEDGFRKAQKPWAKKMKEVLSGCCHGWGGVGLSDQRVLIKEGIYGWVGWALPSGIVPTGEKHCLPGRNIHRWVGSAHWVRRPMGKRALSPGKIPAAQTGTLAPGSPDGVGTALPDRRVSAGEQAVLSRDTATNGGVLLLNIWSQGLHPFWLLRVWAHSSQGVGRGGVDG